MFFNFVPASSSNKSHLSDTETKLNDHLHVVPSLVTPSSMDSSSSLSPLTTKPTLTTPSTPQASSSSSSSSPSHLPFISSLPPTSSPTLLPTPSSFSSSSSSSSSSASASFSSISSSSSSSSYGWYHPSSSFSSSSSSSSSSQEHPPLGPPACTLLPSSEKENECPSELSSSSSSSSSSSGSFLNMEVERVEGWSLPSSFSLPVSIYKRTTRNTFNAVEKDALQGYGSKHSRGNVASALSSSVLPYLHHTDVVPGEYEGGLKTWEGALDLAKYIATVSLEELLNLKIKNEGEVHENEVHVLELGCGSALPTLAFLRYLEALHPSSSSTGPRPRSFRVGSVTLHDFNAFVLQHTTYPNVVCNFSPCTAQYPKTPFFLTQLPLTSCTLPFPVHFCYGDWKAVRSLLPKHTVQCIFSSETIYNELHLPDFCDLLQHVLHWQGVAWVAAKTLYFGVGGGLRSFEQQLVENGSKLISEVVHVVHPTEGSGVPREILKVTWNPLYLQQHPHLQQPSS
ncbi:hypothetical protein HMI55_002467 [Coelomomyces lativittatus]|nr:hypothetical protein HMI56_004203 [Coelomomyces lativittatus]KAJ1503419.1 hypothetical protein HMI55_002467 [Coelomomyces lativittatus]